LWDRFSDETIDLIAEGSRCLAFLWDSAWRAGGGKITGLGAVGKDVLKKRYLDTGWAPSLKLQDIGKVLDKPPNGAAPGRRSRRKR
jgi:hypothetical protein